jgi:hypothetical protein
VARSVEEGHEAAVVLHLVGADVLSDPAGLGLDDGRLSNRVEQSRLPVVDVAHDRDHGRARDEVLGLVLVDLGLELLLVGVLDLHLALELGGDELDRVVGERLRDRDHLADVQHDLDDLRHGHAQRRRKLLDGRAGVHDRRPGRCGGSRLLGALLGCLARGSRVLAWPGGLRVDDDSALATAGRRASPRSQWSLSVSHVSVESSVGILTFLRKVREKARVAAARSKQAGLLHV